MENVDLNGGSLYPTFVDLRAAFELVSHPKLWGILQEMGLPPTILNTLMRLHDDNYARICWGANGEITEKVEVSSGVRQRCVLACTLFLLFINGCVNHLLQCFYDSPTLGGVKTPALLFADDTLLISKTMKGLRTLREIGPIL